MRVAGSIGDVLLVEVIGLVIWSGSSFEALGGTGCGMS